MYQPEQYEGYNAPSWSYNYLGTPHPSPHIPYLPPTSHVLTAPPPPPPPTGPPPPSEPPNCPAKKTNLRQSSFDNISKYSDESQTRSFATKESSKTPNEKIQPPLPPLPCPTNSFPLKSNCENEVNEVPLPKIPLISEHDEGTNDANLENNKNIYISPLDKAHASQPNEHYPATSLPKAKRKRPLPIDLDPSYPPELVAKIQNNECQLCSILLNSWIQAKNHYEGKPHSKKVRHFLNEFKLKNATITTEEESPTKITNQNSSETAKKSKEEAVPAKKAKVDLDKLFCQCCNLSFTSEAHAKQHYLGRNHERVIRGLKPLKDGYFNTETAKWQRMPTDPRVAAAQLNSALPDEEEGKQLVEPEKQRGRFWCRLCNVAATSQEQLDGHLKGNRHLKAVRNGAAKTLLDQVQS